MERSVNLMAMWIDYGMFGFCTNEREREVYFYI
jgi:hypothetical protein